MLVCLPWPALTWTTKRERWQRHMASAYLWRHETHLPAHTHLASGQIGHMYSNVTWQDLLATGERPLGCDFHKQPMLCLLKQNKQKKNTLSWNACSKMCFYGEVKESPTQRGLVSKRFSKIAEMTGAVWHTVLLKPVRIVQYWAISFTEEVGKTNFTIWWPNSSQDWYKTAVYP